MPTMAELCAGGGLLTRALEDVFGVTSVWHAETNPAAARVLATRWPGVPNLGDITNPPGGPYGVPRRRLNAPRRARQAAKRHARRVEGWKAIARPVDLLGAGFPCTPFSPSGKRGGSADERHLWPTGVVPAIEALMPPVVVLENVPNLLRIERGEVFGFILADLDRLGYTVAWTVIGACKVGACHHRHRLFVLAVRSPAVRVPSSEPAAERSGDVWLPVQRVLFGDVQAIKWPPSGISRAGLVWPLPVDTCGDNGVDLLPTPRTSDTNGAGAHDSGGPDLRPVVSLLPTPTAGERRGRHTSPETAAQRMESGRRNLEDAIALLPTPRVSAIRTGRSAILNSASSPSIEQALELARGEVPRELQSLDEAPASWHPLPTPRATDTGTPGRRASEGFRPPLSQVILPMFPTPTARVAGRGKGKPYPEGRPLSEVAALLPDGDSLAGMFGKYELAVRRHEVAFDLAVPAPTEPGRNGNPRLAAPFPEWMMAAPPGFLTDVVSRNDSLRIAGNGVFGPVVGYALSSLPTFPVALSLLAPAVQGVAA
ncbi:DNA cytosine methyltransferase [Micromonospora sp. NPDC000207]|uniref:DNA cytosine methyltransferase n=1 Tax=Micromonospora sp. NPDC000207 TaxID=3154246 RepID=UPI00332EA12A